MFRDAITVFPDNLAVGGAGKLEYARKQGEIEAKELRRLGLDVNLAPVLDVLTEAYSPNIGIRSYGQDWRLVAKLGAACAYPECNRADFQPAPSIFPARVMRPWMPIWDCRSSNRPGKR